MKELITRLCEQGADDVSIGQYVRRWLLWVVAGVAEVINHGILAITGTITHIVFDKNRQLHHSLKYGKMFVTFHCLPKTCFIKKLDYHQSSGQCKMEL